MNSMKRWYEENAKIADDYLFPRLKKPYKYSDRTVTADEFEYKMAGVEPGEEMKYFLHYFRDDITDEEYYDPSVYKELLAGAIKFTPMPLTQE